MVIHHFESPFPLPCAFLHLRSFDLWFYLGGGRVILSQFRFPLVSFCALVVRCFPHPIFLSVLPLCGPGLCGRADLPSELQHARRVWKEIQAQQVCSSLRSRHLLSGSYDPLLCLYVSSPPVVVSGGGIPWEVGWGCGFSGVLPVTCQAWAAWCPIEVKTNLRDLGRRVRKSLSCQPCYV